MKDPVFSGDDVTQAVAAAARALGVPTETLKYVVLEEGRPGGLGISSSPAKIAVLLEAAAKAPMAEEGDEGLELDVEGRIKRVLGAVVEAAGLDAHVSLDPTRDALRVSLEGPGCDFFLADDAEVFQALEHLLQRMFGHAVAPLRLVVDCEGYRDSRDAKLREQALELAAAVRADGKPRLTPPLNAYERRIIHVTLQEADGVRTFSVGEGADRKVTVAPALPGPE